MNWKLCSRTGRSCFWIIGLLAIGSLAGAANSISRSFASKPIFVSDIAGSVQVTSNGVGQTLQLESLLALPANVVTGRDGVLAIRQEKTTVSIAPDSHIEIPEAAYDGQLIARMVQHRGNAFYDVATRDVEKLRVETPYLVAVVKGTQFNVSVQGTTSTISLFEGRLEIRSPDGGDVIELNAGEIAMRSANDTSIRVLRMDEDALPTPDAGTAAARPAGAAGGAGFNVGGDLLPGDGTLALSAPEPGVTLSLDEMLPAQELDAGLLAGVTLDKGIDLGGAGVDLGLDTGVDLGAGTVDLGLDTGVDLGGASVDLGLDTGVDLGAGTADLGLDTGVDLGDAGVDLGLDTSVDLSLDAGLDVDASLDLGVVEIDVTVGETDSDAGGLLLDILPETDTGGGLLNRLF
jgi:hypothetical protein